MSRHTLVVRLDSLGDVVVCGPAVRAVAAGSDRLTFLAGPRGAAAARLLPGVDAVEEFAAPWVLADPAPVDPASVDEVVQRVRALAVDHAVVLTSFHQSALPTALVLRLAGVRRVSAVSVDYPGSLLDDRIAPPPDDPEPLRMTAIAAAAGYRLPPGDDGGLRLRPLPEVTVPVTRPYVVVHPGADAPTRALPAHLAVESVRALDAAGFDVVVTGSAGEARRNSVVAASADHAVDLSGHLDVAGLAAVIAGARAVVCGNTGPGHLAAAVGTPVVSVFAPVVPARRWAPYGPAVAVLGDQTAACRDTRARHCPVEGHPCVSGLSAGDVLAAVRKLTGATPSDTAGAEVGVAR